MSKYSYYLPEEGEGPEHAVEFETRYFDPVYIAEDAAQHDFELHGGWDATWSPTLIALLKDGEELGVFSVSLEYAPSFSASKVDAA